MLINILNKYDILFRGYFSVETLDEKRSSWVLGWTSVKEPGNATSLSIISSDTRLWEKKGGGECIR